MRIERNIRVMDAEQLTGLPAPLIEALVTSGEIPGGKEQDGEFLVGKAALLGWCKLYGKILTAVVGRQPSGQVCGGLTARTLVWMKETGLLTGRGRIRV
jgi:hypothetical protein